MTVIENSIAARWLAVFWEFLCRTARESVSARVLRRLHCGLARLCRGSALCRLAAREGVLSRCWEGSVSCRVLTALLNLPLACVRWIRGVCGGLWDGSVVCRIFAVLGGSPALLTGLLALVMLLAPHEVWNNLYGLVGAAAVTALFILGGAARPSRRLEPSALGPYMLLYGLCICGGLMFSFSVKLSLRFFLFHVCAYLMALLVVSSVRQLRQLRLCAGLAVAGLTAAALYGCAQGIVGVQAVATQWDPALNPDGLGRVYSFFDNPNNFAELLVLLMPLDLALLLTARDRRRRLYCAASLAVCAAAIGLTYSRSGWIGLTVAGVVFLLLTRPRLVPALFLACLLALPLLPRSILARLMTIGNMEDSSTLYRFYIYEATWNLLKDYWVRGVGLGTDVLAKVFRKYPAMSVGGYPIHTHNNYVQLLCEVGLPGLIAYLASVLGCLKAGASHARRTEDRELRCLLAGGVAGLSGLLVIGVAEYTWYYPRNLFLSWFLFGIIMACVRLSRRKEGIHDES